MGKTDIEDFIRRRESLWRAYPEIIELGEVDGFVTHYVPEPDDAQFHEPLALAAGTCAGSASSREEEVVLLSLSGAVKLINVLLEPSRARRLARSLEEAAARVERALEP